MKRRVKYALLVVIVVLIICLIVVLLAINYNGRGNKTDDMGGAGADREKNYCKVSDRGMRFCTQIYEPVCGWLENGKQTFSNSCFACGDEKVEYWTEGECPEQKF